MKYTVEGITQDQYILASQKKKILISVKGGDLTADEVKLIKASPYGKKLIDEGLLKIEADLPAQAQAAEEKGKPAAAPVVQAEGKK